MSTYAEAAGHGFEGSLADAIARLPVAVDDATAASRTWYDTFDWRLFRARATLIHDGARLRWLPRGGGPKTRTADAPQYAREAPSEMRAALHEVAGARALLPRLRLDGTEHRFRHGTVRGAIGHYLAIDPDSGDVADLGVQLWLTGPARAVESLRVRWDLPKKRSLLKQGLRRLERRPNDYSRRIKVALDPAAPTAVAGQVALVTVFEGFERNLPGVLADLDADFLKDLRVAVRRTRAALGALRKAWPADQVAPLRAGLKWLGAVTTPVRDLDVYIERLPAYQATLPTDLQPALAPLGGLLRTLRAAHQGSMIRALTSPGFTALHTSWRDFLTQPAPEHKAARRPIGETARRRTAKIHAAFCAEGRAITAASPAEALHELRKTGKSLRYMLEFFRAVHDPALIKPAIKDMRRLQTHLGTFNDLSIQYTTLGDHARRLRACGAPADTGRAVATLITQLADQERVERLAFAERWAAFDADETQARFATLFDPPSDDLGPTEA